MTALYPPNETPGALAGATGPDVNSEPGLAHRQHTAKRRRKATSLSKTMKRAHLKAARMVGYSLIIGTPEGWIGFARWAAIRLELHERASLAFAALRSLDADTAARVVEAAFEPEAGAGMPGAPFTDFEDEAAFWADRAEPDELAAYLTAIFLAMPQPKRRAFLDFAGRQAA